MTYYFLGSLVSPLNMDKRPEISWNEFHDLLTRNLSPRDLQEMQTVLRFFDLENLRLYLRGASLMNHGNLASSDFDSLFLEPELLEPWWESFIAKEGQKKKDSGLVNELQHDFFAAISQLNSPSARVLSKLWKSQWMAAYVRFETKISQGAFNNEPGIEHERVQQWLQEFAQGLGGHELDLLKNIWQPSGQTLDEIAKSYVRWQIDFFETEHLEHPFEVETLLGYLIQLAWLERWQQKSSPQTWDPNHNAQEALKLVAAHGITTHIPITDG